MGQSTKEIKADIIKLIEKWLETKDTLQYDKVISYISINFGNSKSFIKELLNDMEKIDIITINEKQNIIKQSVLNKKK